MTDRPASFSALGDERFVSLTTFRRNGLPVPTAVWVARDGDDLVVITPDGSGKVKRVRHDGRVELRPCSRTGAVAEGAPRFAGHAALTDETGTSRVRELIRRKYRVEYPVVMLIERIAARERKPRVGLRITAA